MLTKYLEPQTLIQLVIALLMLAAVVYSAIQARAAGAAVKALVNQSFTDRMIDQVRFFAERPDLGKSVFTLYAEEPEDKIRMFMSVHPFLLHFDSVLAMQGQLPKGQFPLYLASMAQIFQEAPVLHEWMNRTRNVWSKELWDIATRSQPKAVSAADQESVARAEAPEAEVGDGALSSATQPPGERLPGE